MSIPEKCTVLVVGAGPGGSYAAAALARENVDTVLLEADIFPRYHIGESMLASMRHLLRFIDLDSTFDNHGFTKKVGAAFKLNGQNREGYTDFIAAGGPENYAWNVVRSEADNLMFQHAGKSGARIFDGVKVNSIHFSPPKDPNSPSPIDADIIDPGRPISASWSRKADGASGELKFDYIVDASGRAGVLSTKYFKNRRFNQGLKNVASWAYWKGTGAYATGTARANSPYFEALIDESGWAWLIPLHNGTTSVGVVMNQDLSTKKKKATSPTPSSQEFYLSSLKLAPNLSKLLANGEQTTDVKSASDYSYSASSYANPYMRLVGDAGCFVDPYFSSGVHLALVGALSAATTICAAIKGECDELTAAKWHSTKVGESYTRFLLVVLSAYKQIRKQDQPVLSDFDEDNFDRAFAFFRPIIQGTADTGNKLSQSELNQTLDFCANAFAPTLPEERAKLIDKLAAQSNGTANGNNHALDESLTAEEERVLKHIRARKMMRTEDTMHIDNFSTDVIDGFTPNLKHGSLGLVLANPMTNGSAVAA